MDYTGAVDMISKMEAEDTGQRSIRISIGEAEDMIRIREYDTKGIASTVNFVERLEGKGRSFQEPHQREVREAAARHVAAAPKDGARAGEDILMEIGGAAKELEDALSSIGNAMSKVTEAKPDRGLVLPGLSPSDQLSELEKIVEGIDTGAFDKEHIGIIKMEVSGLSKSLAARKAPQGADSGILALRDKKLKEVLIKLGIK